MKAAILQAFKGMKDPSTRRLMPDFSVEKLSFVKTVSATRSQLVCSMTVDYRYQGYQGSSRAKYIIKATPPSAWVYFGY
jgi:hypothetical protein